MNNWNSFLFALGHEIGKTSGDTAKIALFLPAFVKSYMDHLQVVGLA